MSDPAVPDVISSLESLLSSVQQAAETSPETLPSKLDAATSETLQIISSILPADQQTPWLSELNKLSQSSFSKPIKHPANIQRCPCGNHLADTPQSRPVTCIHGCQVRFCSATCRKENARGHAGTCKAIARKKALRSLGLTALDEELF